MVHYQKPVSLHICLPLPFYRTYSLLKVNSAFRKYGHSLKVPDFVIHENNKLSFCDFSRESPKLLCRNLPKPLLDALRMRESRTMQICCRGRAPFVKTFRVRGRGRVYWSRTCKTVTSEKETFPNVWERMPWDVAFGYHRRERWHLRKLWSLQYCCEIIGLADSKNLERDRKTASQLSVGSAGLSLKAM